MKQPDTLTVQEAAALLRVEPITIRRWIKSGHLPAFQLRPSGHYRISRSRITEMMGSVPDGRPAA